MCSAGSCIQAVNLTVKLYAKNLGTPWVAPQLSITNTGDHCLASGRPQSSLLVRQGSHRWDDCRRDLQHAGSDGLLDSTSMTGGCASTTGAPNFSWAFVNAGKTSADCYYQVTFSSTAGSLAPGASVADIELRFSKNDFSPYTQANDTRTTGLRRTRPPPRSRLTSTAPPPGARLRHRADVEARPAPSDPAETRPPPCVGRRIGAGARRRCCASKGNPSAARRRPLIVRGRGFSCTSEGWVPCLRPEVPGGPGRATTSRFRW